MSGPVAMACSVTFMVIDPKLYVGTVKLKYKYKLNTTKTLRHPMFPTLPDYSFS